MSENPEVKAPATELKTCPTCHRKLLTQTSILCNWCGAKIDDPNYLARAAEGRQALDQQEREQIEAVVKEETKFGVFGRLKHRAKNKPNIKSLLDGKNP
jgi:ribosomal protein L37AE/L43A